jgi:hypothetical protein
MPHAVVSLRDGTTVAGTVVSTTPTGITLNPDAGGTRDIPMNQVQSITYDQQAPLPAAPVAAAPQTAPAAPPEEAPAAAAAPETIQLAAGAHIPVRADATIDSARTAKGHSYPGQVTRDVRDASGNVVIPQGANARLVVREASKGGRFRGQSTLVVGLQSLSFGGHNYPVQTSEFVEQGRNGVGKNKRTAEFMGGGAGLGAIIGGIAGGGKGALIGGAGGAGAGAVTQAATKGKPVQIPAETVITFRLKQPLKVVENVQ